LIFESVGFELRYSKNPLYTLLLENVVKKQKAHGNISIGLDVIKAVLIEPFDKKFGQIVAEVIVLIRKMSAN